MYKPQRIYLSTRYLSTMDLQRLCEGILQGNKISIARSITLVETDKRIALQLLKLLPKTKIKSFIIGITGPPGVGKSTLIGKLSLELSKRNFKIGIIANDPSSPLSGGAFLGNRIRMDKTGFEDNIFIRSITTKGAVGGISWITESVTKILEVAGYSIIILETVGAGQTDIEISRLADLIAVIIMPDLGDEIQALKAGILELADIIIMNKSDLPNSQQSYIKFRMTIPKEVPIFKVSALNNEGINQLADFIIEKYKEGNYNQERKKERIKGALLHSVSNQLVYDLFKIIPEDIIISHIEDILNRNATIEEATQDIILYIKNRFLRTE